MQIDYVQDEGGDWEGVFADGELVYDGHSIPNAKWLKLLIMVEYQSVEIRLWYSKLPDGGRYPHDFTLLLESGDVVSLD